MIGLGDPAGLTRQYRIGITLCYSGRMTDRGFTPRALGEIAIRCRDFDAMVDFYENTLGLERVQPGSRGGYGDRICFFRLGESYGGHVAVLALFDEAVGGVSMSTQGEEKPLEAGRHSSLHHLALSLPWDEQDAAVAWLQSKGHEVETVPFKWAGWRGVFTCGPDGNTVQLVAADPDWHLS